MPYGKRQFTNNEIYHLVLRGIDDNPIFKDEADYYRGIFSIYEFNNAKPIKMRERQKARLRKKKTDPSTSPTGEEEIDERDKLVDVLAFCLMPSHFHLLVKQTKDGGITRFMRKIGSGYGGYFNKKYGRKGYVFQNRFASILIKDGIQLRIVFVYIHANPSALAETNLDGRGNNNPREVLRFLEKYKWSSYPDYLSKNNFPSVTERGFLLREIHGGEGCKEAVASWIKYKAETKKLPGIDTLALEPPQDGPV